MARRTIQLRPLRKERRCRDIVGVTPHLHAKWYIVQSRALSRNGHLQERLTGVRADADHIMSNDSAKFHCLV